MKAKGYKNLFRKHIELLENCFDDCLSILKESAYPNEKFYCLDLYDNDEIPEIKVYVHEGGEKHTELVDTFYFNESNEIILEYENGFVKFYDGVLSDDIFSLYNFLVNFYHIELEF